MYDSPMTARQIKSAAKAIFAMNQKQKGKTMSNAQSVTTRVNETPAQSAMREAQEAAAAKKAAREAAKAEKLAAREKARAELKQIKDRVKAEKAAKKAAAAAEKAAKPAKAPKAAKDPAAPKVRKPSASSMFCELIMAGELTDDEIFAKVQAAFGLDDGKKSYTKWYRNDLRKKGKNPPGPVVAVEAPVAEATESAE